MISGDASVTEVIYSVSSSSSISNGETLEEPLTKIAQNETRDALSHEASIHDSVSGTCGAICIYFVFVCPTVVNRLFGITNKNNNFQYPKYVSNVWRLRKIININSTQIIYNR